MESKERCEQIIHAMNGSICGGGKEPLLVKFADGGNKKKVYKTNEGAKMWRDGTEAMSAVAYDASTLASNGVASQQVMLPQYHRYNQVCSFLFMVENYSKSVLVFWFFILFKLCI